MAGVSEGSGDVSDLSNDAYVSDEAGANSGCAVYEVDDCGAAVS